VLPSRNGQPQWRRCVTPGWCAAEGVLSRVRALGPIFIVTARGTGAPILAQILDGCCSEIVVKSEPRLTHLVRSLSLDARNDSDSEQGTNGAAAIELARHAEWLERLFGVDACCASNRRWLTLVYGSPAELKLLADLWPDSQFLFVYRECSDTIATLLEQYHFGYPDSDDLSRFIARFPRNFIHGIGLYLTGIFEGMTRTEILESQRCLRIRYEDIVRSPEGELAAISAFTQVETGTNISRALAYGSRSKFEEISRRPALDETSIGSGWFLPIDRLGPRLRERIDDLHRRLGYRDLGDVRDEYAARLERPAVTLGGMTVQLRHSRNATGPQAAAGVRRATNSIVVTKPHHPLSTLLLEAVPLRLNQAPADVPAVRMGASIRLIFADIDEAWVIDYQSREAYEGWGGHATYVAITDSRTIVGVATGAMELSLAMHHGHIRLITAGQGVPGEVSQPDLLDAFLDALAVALVDASDDLGGAIGCAKTPRTVDADVHEVVVPELMP